MSNILKRFYIQHSLNHPIFPEHMSFFTGPRQCGKTTAVKAWLANNKVPLDHYFNWDSVKVKKAVLQDQYFFSNLASESRQPIAFDEIHKKAKWKNYLKDVFDTYKSDFKFIVTGSGRLDHYQRGGDSLAGRYDLYHMFPLTPGEISQLKWSTQLHPQQWLDLKPIKHDLMNDWLELSGFPEPFLASSKAKSKRWWEQYKIRVTEEDLRDLTKLESIDTMRTLLELLPQRLMSPLSYNSLREDLGVSHETVKRYVNTLTKLFITFEVPPYSKKITRSVKKEKKFYFYYHSVALSPEARHENAIALALKTWTTFLTDNALGSYDLFYLRDQNKREVDFLITLDSNPYLLLEAKISSTKLSTSGLYYSRFFQIPFVQIVSQPNIKMKRPDGYVFSLHYLLAALG